MGITNGIVGELRVAEDVALAPAPDAAIAVLVAGEILEQRFHPLAVRVSGIFRGHVRIASEAKGVIHTDIPVEHEPVEVGMSDVAPEFPQFGATWPDCLGEVRARELT